MSQVYDILVLGGGPAGMSAAMYGGRSRLKTAILEKGKPGGQASTTAELENYPGFFRETTGPDVMNEFAAHAERFGAVFIKGTAVDVQLEGPIKTVKTSDGKEYQAHCVILAPGAEPRLLGTKGEGKLRGKGVSYCATCDADFFEELDVVVVGNGDTAIEEAIYLTKFAENVTMIIRRDEGQLGCNKASAEKAMGNKKMKWIWNSVVDEIVGDELVESVRLKNLKTGEITDYETNGVFIFIGTVPKTEFLKGSGVKLDEYGSIITNELMETNIPGVYGAGDANRKFLRQVVTAAADGAIAAVAAGKYLEEVETFREKVLESALPVLVAFWTPQVEASASAVATLESFVQNNAGKVSLVKFDAYRDEKLSATYQVKDVPTVILFDKGQIVGRIDGQFTADDLNKLINK